MSNKITFGKIFTQSFSTAFIVALIISLLTDWFTGIPDNKLYLVFFGSLTLSMAIFITVWLDKRHELEIKNQEAKKRLNVALKANERPGRHC